MRISDWSSDVCSSDLGADALHPDHDDRMERICAGLGPAADVRLLLRQRYSLPAAHEAAKGERPSVDVLFRILAVDDTLLGPPINHIVLVYDVLTSGTHYRAAHQRSEEHTSEIQSLMRISYAVLC